MFLHVVRPQGVPPALANKPQTLFPRHMFTPIRATPLAALNDAERLAVEHGAGDADGPQPLLVIAGAGAGKTNINSAPAYRRAPGSAYLFQLHRSRRRSSTRWERGMRRSPA